MSVRQFPVIDLSWLRFIVANRYNLLSAAEHNLQRRFDIVHGLVADDKVVQILDDLRNEMISEEDALIRINGQKDDEFYLSRADYVIKNYEPHNMKEQLSELEKEIFN